MKKKADDLIQTVGRTVDPSGCPVSGRSMNLTKYLSLCGVASRRRCAELISAGQVTVNGIVIINGGSRVSVSDRIFVNGQAVAAPCPPHHYIMLNKPRGYTCSHSDRHAEKLAVSLIDLADQTRLAAAGRLDRDSEGMLIFSDDGAYLDHLSHPRYEICKRYEVELKHELLPAQIERAQTGIDDDGEILRVLRIRPIGPRRYEIILNEGKKREIRRITAALGAPTKKLRRVAIGGLQLGDLTPGQWRELTRQEIELSLRPGIPPES